MSKPLFKRLIQVGAAIGSILLLITITFTLGMLAKLAYYGFNAI